MITVAVWVITTLIMGAVFLMGTTYGDDHGYHRGLNDGMRGGHWITKGPCHDFEPDGSQAYRSDGALGACCRNCHRAGDNHVEKWVPDITIR